MDITPFICELLFSHDCVIVPGFGGFVGNYASARIDRATFTFYPPAKQISFNRNLRNNDGLLAGRISEQLQISFSDSVNLIEEFVTDIRTRIDRKEKVVFENIGLFSVNHEGSIQFEPQGNINYHRSSYGLESFQFSPAEAYDVRKRVTGHSVRDTDRRHDIRTFLWKAAVIVPLLAAATIIPLKTSLFRPRLETTTLNPIVKSASENTGRPLAGAEINNAAADNRENIADAGGDAGILPSDTKSGLPAGDVQVNIPVAVAETHTSAADSEISVPAADASTDAEALRPFPGDRGKHSGGIISGKAPAPGTEGQYCLITGSFRLRENADQQAEALRREGFSPEIISSINGFFRVSAMRCRDLPAAIEKQKDLDEKYPGIWIRKI
ncbi:MAG TPA: SPOR domain-containing protein [Bacteroidales bacterium]|jgi:nucleoid DNA-binding protein|nr:SPOR domain-containing protein [Bacteroidales bacterium]HOS72789.1 SPOR domain-containing protein [Bacteroidales bacterium]HQH23783.1 SPOR domain-containing protein [Bacteroidales bacterium]HQJ81608.1 SPOR domain-containing protein [Bacteroidales bacterium]